MRTLWLHWAHTDNPAQSPQVSILSLITPANCLLGFRGGTVVKNLPANAVDAKDAGSIPASGRSHSNILAQKILWKKACAWQATAHEVTKSWTRLRDWTRSHTSVFWVQGHTHSFQGFGCGYLCSGHYSAYHSLVKRGQWLVPETILVCLEKYSTVWWT